MSDEFHTGLAEAAPDEFTAQPLRPRTLKDLGRVQLWWCGRAGEDVSSWGPAADRRRNLRWERLAEILPDLDELRDVGERVMAARRRPADGPAASTDGSDDASGAGEPDRGDAVGA
jgi:hypothetical protein